MLLCIFSVRQCLTALLFIYVNKLPLGRTRHRWEDNIKMDLHEVGCGDMDWIELAQNRERWPAHLTAVTKCGEFLE